MESVFELLQLGQPMATHLLQATAVAGIIVRHRSYQRIRQRQALPQVYVLRRKPDISNFQVILDRFGLLRPLYHVI